jgi:hypothetical protein
MDPVDVETKVNACLALKTRNHETVAACVGPDFAQQYAHLTAMLCERNLDIQRLLQLLATAASVRSGAQTQEAASEEVGLDLAKAYVPAVRDQYK